MAKITGPALSTQASGSIAAALTFSKTQRGAYAKQHRRPKQPNTPKQRAVKAAMKFLAENWRTLTPANQATWIPRANRSNIFPYHAFVAANMKRWSTFQAPSKEDPATGTNINQTQRSTTITAGVAMVTFCIFAPMTIPEWGWIIHRAPNTTFVPTLETVIGFLPMSTHLGWNCYIDTPLAAGTYRYMRQTFRPDGTLMTDTRYNTVTVT